MEISRRKFIGTSAKAAIGIGALSAVPLLASCSSNNESSTSSPSKYAALRVSSDPYKSDLEQRFAFSIFEGTEVAASGNLSEVTVTSPSGKKEIVKNVKIRDKGITGQGIYSLPLVFGEAGSWKLDTTFKGNKLDLSFSVAENATAPAIGNVAPISTTPTIAKPLDAEVLCTAFDGTCELHDHSIDEVAKRNNSYVVIFATPARCQTAYCGPVLDLTREVAKEYDYDVIHIEIYKNETTNDTLDAVKTWNLPSEPWIFGIGKDGKVDWRLDGAFDQSEVEELFIRLA